MTQSDGLRAANAGRQTVTTTDSQTKGEIKMIKPESELLRILMMKFKETGTCTIEINAGTYYRPQIFRLHPAKTKKNMYLAEEGLNQALLTKSEARQEIRAVLSEYVRTARVNGWHINHLQIL